MKIYDVIFFHVFKRYNKGGVYRDDIPWLTASSIMGVSCFLYFISFYDIVYFLIKGYIPEISKPIFLPIGLIIALANLFWFMFNKRYLVIYDAHKEKYGKDVFTEILAWLYVIGSLVLFTATIIKLRL